MLYMIDNIHNERGTYYTDSTLPGYYIMSVVCILYRYQDSALNHILLQLENSQLMILGTGSASKVNSKPEICAFEND